MSNLWIYSGQQILGLTLSVLQTDHPNRDQHKNNTEKSKLFCRGKLWTTSQTWADLSSITEWPSGHFPLFGFSLFTRDFLRVDWIKLKQLGCSTMCRKDSAFFSSFVSEEEQPSEGALWELSIFPYSSSPDGCQHKCNSAAPPSQCTVYTHTQTLTRHMHVCIVTYETNHFKSHTNISTPHLSPPSILLF